MVWGDSSDSENTAVSAHYNRHRPRSESSPQLLEVRKFHNLVKSVLIARACEASRQSGGAGSRYLDLCCGNGGDIGKLKFHDIHEYIGIEFANQAAERALQRLEQSPLQGDVITLNAFSISCGEMLSNMRKFDIASCQFALHYAFKTEYTARTLVQNVAHALRVGGSFICTVPDADFLARSMKLLGRRISDKNHTIHFDTSTLADDGSFRPFGSKYTFSLAGAVDALDEYIVHESTLAGLCEDCGMELLESRSFADYESTERDSDLWNRTGAAFHDISRLYRTYHFRMKEFVSYR